MKRLLILILIFVADSASACDRQVRAYNTAATVNFCLFTTDGTVGAVKVESAVHASGDTYIMKDEAAEANTTNAFVDEGSCYSIALTATEMQAARIVLNIEDQSTKTWADKCIIIETFGNASAQFPTADVNVISASDTAEYTSVPTTGAEDLLTMMRVVYQLMVNKFDSTASEQTWYQSNGSSVWTTKDIADDATTYSRTAQETND